MDAILREILGPEMDVNATDPNGDTAFHRAAVHPDCDIAVVRKLLDMEASLDTENNYGQSPLHLFLKGKPSYDLIEFILDNGACINVFDRYHYTPLHYILHDFECNPDIVRLLLERGSDVNECSENEETPLHLAAIANNLEVMHVLFEYGADVNASDSDYFTPIHYALNSCRCEISVIRLLLEKGADIYVINGHGQQALHAAANKCNADIVRLILDRGANVNAMDAGIHESPLNQALNAPESDLEVVKLLLDEGADTQSINENGENILHWVVCTIRYDIVKLLVDHGALINALDTQGKSPLHFALNSTLSDPEVIKLLIKKGANINITDHLGQHPLHLAAFNWDSCIVELLLEYGASADVINILGYTPLFNSIYNQNSDWSLPIQKLLFKSGAIVHHGFSPLEAVVEKLNSKDIRSSAEKFSMVLQCAKLILKYSLLEGPMLDFKEIRIDSGIAVHLLDYGRNCLSELSTDCLGLGSNLKMFIIQQQREEQRDVEKILRLLSKNQYLMYREVIGGLLTKRHLREKLSEQIEILSRNRSTIILNYECLSKIVEYICTHDDLLNLVLTFELVVNRISPCDSFLPSQLIFSLE